MLSQWYQKFTAPESSGSKMYSHVDTGETVFQLHAATGQTALKIQVLGQRSTPNSSLGNVGKSLRLP